MMSRDGFGCSEYQRSGFGCFSRTILALWAVHILVFQPVDGLRPLRERARSWGDEVCRVHFFLVSLSILFGYVR